MNIVLHIQVVGQGGSILEGVIGTGTQLRGGQAVKVTSLVMAPSIQYRCTEMLTGVITTQVPDRLRSCDLGEQEVGSFGGGPPVLTCEEVVGLPKLVLGGPPGNICLVHPVLPPLASLALRLVQEVLLRR